MESGNGSEAELRRHSRALSSWVLDMPPRVRHNDTYKSVIFSEVAMARRRTDPKEEALREARALNPRLRGGGRRRVRFLGVLRRPGPGPGALRDGPPGAGRGRDGLGRRGRASGSPGRAGTPLPRRWTRTACPDCCGLGPDRAGLTSSPARSWQFLTEALEAEPGLRAPELARRVEESFGISVHPRSVERALERARRPKSR